MSSMKPLALLAVALMLSACGDKTPAPATTAGPETEAPATGAEPAAGTTPPVHDVTADYPALKMPTLDGSSYDLAAHRGQWVVVNFWATWCSPCLKEMPELSALHAMREHVKVVGLAYDDIAPAELKAFMKRHPVAYPIVQVDTFNPPADFATPRGLPTTYLIAPDGKLAKQFLGPVTAREIEAAIAAAGGKPA